MVMKKFICKKNIKLVDYNQKKIAVCLFLLFYVSFSIYILNLILRILYNQFVSINNYNF